MRPTPANHSYFEVVLGNHLTGQSTFDTPRAVQTRIAIHGTTIWRRATTIHLCERLHASSQRERR